MTVRELQHYSMYLNQTSGGGNEKQVVIPEGKKLLVKQVVIELQGMLNINNDNNYEVTVGVYNLKNFVPKYGISNVVIQNRNYGLISGGGSMVSRALQPGPFVWNPPPSFFLYGRIIMASLFSTGTTGSIASLVQIYGTLSDVDELTRLSRITEL